MSDNEWQMELTTTPTWTTGGDQVTRNDCKIWRHGVLVFNGSDYAHEVPTPPKPSDPAEMIEALRKGIVDILGHSEWDLYRSRSELLGLLVTHLGPHISFRGESA